MKKAALKLTLNRETLRSLEQSQLKDVEGAATLSLCVGSCAQCTRPTCLC